ncbi:MAG: MarR family transcriptional regulator [Bacteroidales bacterium]|nr:MarR family transcriptional regulator [Bacteroidales bacterium]
MIRQQNLPETSLVHLISNTSKILNVLLGKHFQQEGIDLTAEQWSILLSLWNKDGQCQYELANCQGKDRASITRLIDNIEKRNLVLRVPSPTDRRHKLIYLTTKGNQLKNSTNKIAENTIKQATQGISKKELGRAIQVISRIEENLNQRILTLKH